jgi:zinc and cadmium transporter
MLSPFLLSFISVVAVSLLSFLGILFFLFEEKNIRKSLLFFVSLSTGALLGDVFIHMIPDMAKHPETFTRDLYLGDHHGHNHPVGIVNLVGESMHNFIDGLVIAAGFLASPTIGFSTTLAVILHEMPHEIGNVAVLLHVGYSRKKALFYNFLSATVSIFGVLVVYLFTVSSDVFGAYMLPFAAGNLLYIAGSDLIPELHKENKALKSLGQLVCILIGMAIMYGVKLME